MRGESGRHYQPRHGFAPVIDTGVRLLVLGSFPSTASLAAHQYYGHPRNQFWPLLSALLDDDLVGFVHLSLFHTGILLPLTVRAPGPGQLPRCLRLFSITAIH